MSTIEERIDERIGEVRTEAIDISFGEIIALHQNKELIIHPEYLRLFRWSPEQQSRLIESILLELPIPQVFVIENTDGVLELVDGLQRISSVIRFIEPDLLSLDPLILEGCDLIEELNGKLFEDLPLRLRLRLRRSSVRMIVIKRQSSFMLRYELFKRLNTGGSLLSAQEIRNCTARMIGEAGIEFYKFLQSCASSADFKKCTETLAETDRDQKADEELVLRFFALKNSQDTFRGSVRDWLDEYMEEVILGHIAFAHSVERKEFDTLFTYLASVLGAGAFVRYKGGAPIGGLAPAYFEAVTMGVFQTLSELARVPEGKVRDRIIAAVEGVGFREFTGPAANSRQKLTGRIQTVVKALRELVDD